MNVEKLLRIQALEEGLHLRKEAVFIGAGQGTTWGSSEHKYAQERKNSFLQKKGMAHSFLCVVGLNKY